MTKISVIRTGATLLSASVILTAIPAAATVVAYTFLDPLDDVSLTVTTAPVTSTATLPSDFCSVPALCSSVTFTPTASYDEVTLLDGENFFFAPTAFTKVSANFETPAPASANPTAEFSTLIAGTVPEPSTWLLAVIGIGLAGGVVRKKRDAVEALTAAT